MSLYAAAQHLHPLPRRYLADGDKQPASRGWGRIRLVIAFAFGARPGSTSPLATKRMHGRRCC